MRREPSQEAVNLALELYETAQRRSRRGENDPTYAIACALQSFMDQVNELAAKVQLLQQQIAVTS